MRYIRKKQECGIHVIPLNKSDERRRVTSGQQPSPSTSGLHVCVTFITQQLVRFLDQCRSLQPKSLFKIAAALGTYLLATVTTMRSFDSLDGLY